MKNLIAFFFFIAVFFSFTKPIWDVDFPWHLKTGEYIFQNQEIPITDPFSDASSGSLTEKFLISNYWLAQVFFYIIFSKAGPLGIVILRSLLLTGIIIILWRSMKETPLLLKIILLYFTAIMFTAYSGERPQLFSFLFSLLLVAVLESYRKNKSIKVLFFLPLLMLLWANMHGGFILGDVLIMVVCMSETVKYFFLRKYARPLTPKHLFWLVGAGFLSIAISYLNPNGYYAFTFTMDSMSASSTIIREYITPIVETRGAFVSSKNFIYWVISGYCLVLLALNLRRGDITHFALVLFTLLVSLTAMRFVPFFVMTGLFISGSYGFGIGGPRGFKLAEKAIMPLNIILLVVVVVWAGFQARSLPDRSQLNQMGRSSLHCEAASQFIKKNIPEGKLFNSSSTGGYLIFRLYPKFKTFIDTRGYSLQNKMEADTISYAERWEGDICSLFDAFRELLPKDHGTITVSICKKPAFIPKKEKWLELLDKYNIDIIVHEACSFFSGEVFPLPLRLIKNEEWRLVYIDGRVLIFVRNVQKHRDLIAKHELAKTKVYDEIGIEMVKAIGAEFNSAPVYSSMAFALLMKGSPEDAVRKYLKQALYLDPKDFSASYLEAFLALKKEEK